jgi:hypothetical protein
MEQKKEAYSDSRPRCPKAPFIRREPKKLPESIAILPQDMKLIDDMRRADDGKAERPSDAE